MRQGCLPARECAAHHQSAYSRSPRTRSLCPYTWLAATLLSQVAAWRYHRGCDAGRAARRPHAAVICRCLPCGEAHACPQAVDEAHP